MNYLKYIAGLYDVGIFLRKVRTYIFLNGRLGQPSLRWFNSIFRRVSEMTVPISSDGWTTIPTISLLFRTVGTTIPTIYFIISSDGWDNHPHDLFYSISRRIVFHRVISPRWPFPFHRTFSVRTIETTIPTIFLFHIPVGHITAARIFKMSVPFLFGRLGQPSLRFILFHIP